jgi:hypothetical protein
MESYRVFGVNAHGRIVSDQSFDCGDDAEARSLAHTILKQPHGIEVWDVSRCVFKIASAPIASDGAVAPGQA